MPHRSLNMLAYLLVPLMAFAMNVLPAAADDWPQWMGPNRDDVWRETGIIESFPQEGLTFLWRQPISGGFAGPAVAGGKVYVTDYVRTAGNDAPKPTVRNALQGKERVLCLDAKTGSEIWKHEYDCPYEISYAAGPRCTPTIADGKVYTLGAMGDLYCLDADKGTVIWSKNLPKAYGADVPLWGYAGHPLIYKDTIIVTPGGKDSTVVALNKNTGDQVWKSLDTRKLGYSPPTLIEAGGVTQLLIFHGESVNSLDPDTGKPHWSQPIATAFSMAIMAPCKGGDYLFVGGHNGKSIGRKLDADRPAATKVWTGSRDLGLAPVSGTPFVENGIAYGIHSDGFFRAIRIDTGERLWATARPVNGRDVTEGRSGSVEGATFITRNGNRFFLFGENGDLIIAKLSAEKYDEISRTKLLEPVGNGLGRKIVWSHPAYANKCVFARNDKEIVCASLEAK